MFRVPRFAFRISIIPDNLPFYSFELMNLTNNRRLLTAGSVFMLLVGFTYFAVQFFKQTKVDNLLVNEMQHISSIQSITWKGIEENDMQLNSELPSYKEPRKSTLVDNVDLEVDFPSYSNLENTEPSNKNNSIAKSSIVNVNNELNYSYTQKKSITYASSNQIISSKPNTFISSNNIQPTNSGVQFVANIDNKFQSTSNNLSNSFLANNTLTISTDLSDNNSPMLIDGDTNPSEPGIPVGDGTLILLGFAMAYCSKRKLVKTFVVVFTK